MWIRWTLVLSRAAILKSRKRIWPMEAASSSVPLKTSAPQSAHIQMRKGREPQPQLVGSQPVGAGAICKENPSGDLALPFDAMRRPRAGVTCKCCPERPYAN
jgi:hypothetical protein